MRPADITAARERLGLTQEEVAAHARVSEQTVSRIERGIRVRPNSLKDVYAVLNLAYEPIETVELVMPERLIGVTSTEAMRQATKELPQVEYLVRPDPVAWKDHVFGEYRRHPYSAFRRYDLIPQAIVAALLGIPLFTWIIAMEIEAFSRGIILGSALLCLFALMAGLYIRAMREVAMEFRNDFITCPDLDVGYAFSENEIWKLCVQEDRVFVRRISIQGMAYRTVTTDGPFMNLRIRNGEEVDEIGRLPLHQGIIDLIDRVRRDDKHRVIFVSPSTAVA